MVTFGSRGDVEPFATLGRELVDAGHEVRLVSHAMFAGLCDQDRLEFAPVRGRSVRELLESEEAQALQRMRHRPLKLTRGLTALLEPELQLMYEDMLAAVQGSDAVLCFPATVPAIDVAT